MRRAMFDYLRWSFPDIPEKHLDIEVMSWVEILVRDLEGVPHNPGRPRRIIAEIAKRHESPQSAFVRTLRFWTIAYTSFHLGDVLQGFIVPGVPIFTEVMLLLRDDALGGRRYPEGLVFPTTPRPKPAGPVAGRSTPILEPSSEVMPQFAGPRPTAEPIPDPEPFPMPPAKPPRPLDPFDDGYEAAGAPAKVVPVATGPRWRYRPPVV